MGSLCCWATSLRRPGCKIGVISFYEFDLFDCPAAQLLPIDRIFSDITPDFVLSSVPQALYQRSRASLQAIVTEVRTEHVKSLAEPLVRVVGGVAPLVLSASFLH